MWPIGDVEDEDEDEDDGDDQDVRPACVAERNEEDEAGDERKTWPLCSLVEGEADGEWRFGDVEPTGDMLKLLLCILGGICCDHRLDEDLVVVMLRGDIKTKNKERETL
jgi:hypothetical protein